MKKEITITTGNKPTELKIEQTIAQPEPTPTGPSIGGVSLTTGYGMGVDIAVVLGLVSLLYLGKKLFDKFIK